uniref:Uncharacterized protein n=1 Tax=Cucumis melo TaxID=3656 RepID=A0A9I9EBB9_CUCME
MRGKGNGKHREIEGNRSEKSRVKNLSLTYARLGSFSGSMRAFNDFCWPTMALIFAFHKDGEMMKMKR